MSTDSDRVDGMVICDEGFYEVQLVGTILEALWVLGSLEVPPEAVHRAIRGVKEVPGNNSLEARRDRLCLLIHSFTDRSM